MVKVVSIQVSGLREFPAKQWREAILYYLFGVWGEKSSVMCRPKINLEVEGGGSITLRPNGEKEAKYYVYGDQIHTPKDTAPRFSNDQQEEHVQCSRWQTTFEHTLVRFVKNNRIREFTLWLPSNSFVTLRKDPSNRGSLEVFAMGASISHDMKPY